MVSGNAAAAAWDAGAAVPAVSGAERHTLLDLPGRRVRAEVEEQMPAPWRQEKNPPPFSSPQSTDTGGRSTTRGR